MTARWAKFINGLLILFSSLIVFIGAENILKSGAAGIENKVAALFILFNLLIILCTVVFGVFWNIFYLFLVFLGILRLVELYHIRYLIYFLPAYILTSLIISVIRIKMLFQIKGYRNRIEVLEPKLALLNKDFEESEKIKEALKRKFERLSNLKFIAEELSTTLTLEEVTRCATDRIIEIIPRADTSLIYLVDDRYPAGDNPELVLSSVTTKAPESESGNMAADIFDRWMLRHVEPLIVTDAKRDFRFSIGAVEEIKRDFRSLIASPLISENRIVGIVRLDSPTPDSFAPDDLRILDIFSDLVAVAIENALLYRKMEELARKDGLTELYLPRYFHMQMETMINSRRVKNLSLLMLDIDYFKEYNDRYGHIAGDIMLRKIAASLSPHLLEHDFAVRYGGEEFLLVLVDCDHRTAIERAESVRQEIAGQIFSLRREATQVTVSIGIATYPDDGKTKEELLHKADEWLYYAKEKGRNRIAYTPIK